MDFQQKPEEHDQRMYNPVDFNLVIKSLIKNWIIIVVFTIIALIISGFYYFLTAPIYESTAIIKIGYTTNPLQTENRFVSDKPIFFESPITLIRKIKEKYSMPENSDANQQGIYVAADVDKSSPNDQIIIKVTSDSATKSYTCADLITNELLNEHLSLYMKLAEVQNKKMNLLRDRLALIESQLIYLDSLNARELNDYSKTSAAFEKAKLQIERNQTEIQLMDTSLSSSIRQNKKTEVISKPILSDISVRPKKINILIITFTGFILGVLMTLVKAAYNQKAIRIKWVR